MAVLITNGVIQINQFRTNALMNQGKTSTNSWIINTKSNIVLGQVAGNFNVFSTGANILSDPEVIDNPIINNSVEANLAPGILELI
jgi:hypothetical protein